MRYAQTAFMAVSASLFLVAGCANVPTDGPSARAIASAGDAGSLRVERLSLNEEGTWRAPVSRAAADMGAVTGPLPTDRVEVGDRLDIAIFEGMAEGVFGTSAEGGSRFEGVLVAPDGTIRVPYAGVIRAAGRDVGDVRQSIVAGVRRFTIRPDAIVSVASRNRGSVSVGGAVRAPGRFVIGQDVLTLLDAVSKAGAPLEAPYSSTVIVRGPAGARTTTLADIAFGSSAPLTGDTEVVVIAEPATFQVLGSVRAPGSQPIVTADLSLLEALSTAGGLDGARANPRGVFVFRNAPAGDPDPRPRVYQLDMRAPQSFAIASAFPIWPGDALYVTEAPVAQWSKVLSAVQGTIGIGATAATAQRLVRD